MGDCLLSNFDLAKLHFDWSNIIRNFKVIYARNFSLCCVQLLYIQTCNKKNRQIDYNILYLNWFRDYPQRGTQYRFGFSVVTSLFVVESITRQWNIDISFISVLFFSEKMNLIPNQTIVQQHFSKFSDDELTKRRCR